MFGKLQAGDGTAIIGVTAPIKTVESEENAPETQLPRQPSPSGPPHPCDICSKVFPYRYQMIVHRRYHTERKPFQCQVQSLLFSKVS